MLAVEGLDPAPTTVHHLLDSGSFAITVPANGPHPQDVTGLLDLIATQNPNPALLQVNTGSRQAAGGTSPDALVRLEIDTVVVADATGAESVVVDTLLDAEPDVRLPFTKPVDDVTGLNQAIRVLMGCPFLNGVRARRI